MSNTITPGRTHISWTSQSGQISELISYIGFLEAKVSYLQYHHEHCDAWEARSPVRDLSSPYLPPDFAASDQSSDDESPPTKKRTFSNTSVALGMGPPKKAVDRNPRWRRIVDQITRGWDKHSAWTDKRQAIGLNSVEQNQHALTLILGLRNGLPPTWYDTPQSPSPSTATSRTDALIMSARQYALATKSSQLQAGFVVQVHIFREFVFASLCVVMEQQGLPIDTINDLMRICMSSSGPANLYRLRRGALWVNRVISGTMIRTMGWGRASTEFFLLSGRPVSQYGLLWEACMHSFPYLSNRLAQISTVVEVPVEESGWIPFSIPIVIKQLVGEALTLEQICTALDYKIDDL